jgi:hypothetical protein
MVRLFYLRNGQYEKESNEFTRACDREIIVGEDLYFVMLSQALSPAGQSPGASGSNFLNFVPSKESMARMHP